MKKDCLKLMRSIYRANKSVQKKENLGKFLEDFEVLKLEVRLATEMKLLSVKKQAELVFFMESIGRQIVGWRKSSLK